MTDRRPLSPTVVRLMERGVSPPPVAFGALIQRFRLMSGLTQEELAARAGISARSISDFERGLTHRPQRETIRLLADALRLGEDDRVTFAAAARGRPTVLPQLVPPAAPLHNLPTPLTPLVGRHDDLAALTALLRRADVRLVTVTGLGGIGKTRLALDAAAQLRGDFPDGVFFVSLAAVRDPNFVLGAIAQVLGVKETPGKDIRESVTAHLARKRLLLVLDNFEQIVPAAIAIAELLIACSTVKALVTSRATLHVRGEHEWPIGPLRVPDLRDLPETDILADVPAVTLFVQRAEAVRPDFRLTDENRAAIAALCAHLDGLPLAIELAAARIRAMTPAELLARLTHRLPLLTGGAYDLPVRQQTMRDTIAWSYDLLSARDQRLFRALAIFVGGWTLDAMERVVSAPGTTDETMLAALTTLIDHSLVQVESTGDTTRYVILETIREYGYDQLAAMQEREALRRAHADYFVAFAEEALPHLAGPEQAIWLDRLEAEHDNLRAILSDARVRGDSATGLQLAGALWIFWQSQGHNREGCEWLESLLTLSAQGDQESRAAFRARALNGAGALAYREGDYPRAMPRLLESLTLRRALQDTSGIGQTLNNLGLVATDMGDAARGAMYFEESLGIWRTLENTRGIDMTLNNLGHVAQQRGEYHKAIALLEESVRLKRAQGNLRGIAQTLNNLAGVANELGNDAQAIAYVEESLGAQEHLKQPAIRADSLSHAGYALFKQGDLAQAMTLHEESLALRRELGDTHGIAISLRNLGCIAYEQGDPARATTLLHESVALGVAIGVPIGCILCLEALAAIYCRENRMDFAVQLLGTAQAVRDVLGRPLSPTARSAQEATITAARNALGERAFVTAWDAGQAMSLAQACDAVGTMPLAAPLLVR